MQAAVFDYAVNLCADLSHQHALHSIVLETPGWQPYGHGYHHEFAQVASNPWLDNMLGMCFCDACKSAAKDKGIAIDALQTRVQNNISNYLALPADAQADQAASWTQSELLTDPDLLAYISMRQDRVHAIGQCDSQSDSKPLRTGSDTDSTTSNRSMLD